MKKDDNFSLPNAPIRNLKIEHDAAFQAIQETYQQTQPGPANPLVIVDPYRCNSLVAMVCIRTEKPAKMAISVGIGDADTDISFDFASQDYHQDHFIPVAGLYPDSENKVVITISYDDGTTEEVSLTLQTDPLPSSAVLLPEIRPISDYPYTENLSLMAKGFTFFAPQSAYILGVDAKRVVRWILLGDYVNSEFSNIERLANGNFLMCFGFYELREVDILGRCVRQTMMTSRMHHDWYEMANGQLVLTVEDADKPDNYVMDVTTIIDYPNSAETVSEFRFREALDVTRIAKPNVNAQGPNDEKDWLHINRSVYDPTTDSVITSGRHQNCVISVTAAAGALDHALTIDDINWIMGPHDYWGEEWQSKLLTPLSSEGTPLDNDAANADFWNWGQHSVTLPADQPEQAELTDIIIFNNGNYRHYDDALATPASKNFSECSRYRINLEEMTIQRTWTFGRELGSARYGSFVGSVRDHENTYLVNHGGICLNEEGVNVGTHWGDPDNDGSITAISPHVCIYEVLKESKEVIWGMEFSWKANPYFIFFNFKAVRAPMYPQGLTIYPSARR